MALVIDISAALEAWVEPAPAPFAPGTEVWLMPEHRTASTRALGLDGLCVYVGPAPEDDGMAVVRTWAGFLDHRLPTAHLVAADAAPTPPPSPEPEPGERVRWLPAIFPGMAAPLTRVATNADGTVRVRGPHGGDIVTTPGSITPARVLVSLTEAEHTAIRRVLWRSRADDADPDVLDLAQRALADPDDTCQTCARHHTEPHVTGCPGDVSDRETGEQL